MFDIHTHLIPNVDDGSKSLEISKELILKEIEYGVKKIMLTPHQNKNTLNKEKILNAFNKFKDDCKDLNIELYLGSEIYYYDGLLEDLENNLHTTYNNTKYILVEFSTRMETDIKDKLFDLLVKGYKVILAHIERYPYLKISDYKELHDMGVLIQVNTKTFKGRHFKKELKYLLKNNYLDFIGTDTHDLDSRNVEYEDCLKMLKKYPTEYKRIIEEEPIFFK